VSELKLSPSEALYGFAGWLTTRGCRTVMSSSDDASPIAELVARFCRENDLEAPRDRWPVLLKHPPEAKPSAFAGESCAIDAPAAKCDQAERTKPDAAMLLGQLLDGALKALMSRDFSAAAMLVRAFIDLQATTRGTDS
jgi:hypothetical protein